MICILAIFMNLFSINKRTDIFFRWFCCYNPCILFVVFLEVCYLIWVVKKNKEKFATWSWKNFFRSGKSQGKAREF